MGSNRRVWFQLPDGTATQSDALVEMPDGRWVKPSPVACPNGHAFQPGRTVVGWQACHSVDCGGHTAHTCRICGEAVYSPERQPGCEAFAFDGRG